MGTTGSVSTDLCLIVDTGFSHIMTNFVRKSPNLEMQAQFMNLYKEWSVMMTTGALCLKELIRLMSLLEDMKSKEYYYTESIQVGENTIKFHEIMPGKVEGPMKALLNILSTDAQTFISLVSFANKHERRRWQGRVRGLG